jgi:hypothetical protein
MRQITPLSLISVLANLKGGTMVYLTSLTDVDVPFQYRLGRVQKFCRQSMQIGCSYENSVNNKLERKGLSRSFRSSRLRWGRWFILNRIIEHRGKYYARFYKTANSNPQITYLVDGRVATPREVEIIKRYDSLYTFSHRQNQYGLSRTEQTNVRNYELTNIISISAEGETYNVVREQPVTATR